MKANPSRFLGGLCPLLVFWGCADPMHESQLFTPSPTAHVGEDPLNDSYWEAHVIANEEWLDADSTLQMQISEVEGNEFGAWLRHVDGTVIAGGVEIPSDKWIKMDGQFLAERTQILLQVEDFGHQLLYDADLSPGGSHLNGYFIVDESYRLYVEIDRVSQF